MATTTPAVAVRKLEDVRIIVVTPWSRQIAGISYNDCMVAASTCCSARVAIEQFCSAATLARLRKFVHGDLGPSLWVLERAAKFEGLFWIINFKNNKWQIKGKQSAWDNAVKNLINELEAGDLQSQRLCGHKSAVADLEAPNEDATDFCCVAATHWCNTCKIYSCAMHNVRTPQNTFAWMRNEADIAVFDRPSCLTCELPLFSLCLHDVQHVGKVLCHACPRTFIEVASLDAHLDSEAHGDRLAMGPPFHMSASCFRGRGRD